MKRIVFAFVAAAWATPCLAQLKSERVPAATAAAVYSMDVHDVSPADAIAAFRKQTGITIGYEDRNGMPDRGPPVLYDVKFDNLPGTAAVRELAQALSLGITDGGDGTMVLSRFGWSNAADASATRGVTLGSVTRSQTVPPTPDQPDTLNLGVRVSAGDGPTDGTLKFKIDSATDEQGRTIEPFADNMPGRFSGLNLSNSEITLSLVLPKPRPKRLVLVRGAATVGRPKTLLRVTCDKLPDAAAECAFDGGTLSVGPLTPEGKGFSLPMNFTRGAMPDDRWGALLQQINRLRTAVEITAQDDTRLAFAVNNWSSPGDTIRFVGRISWPPASGHTDQDPVPRPTKLKFDTVVESESDPIAFEFKDVLVP